MGCEGGSTSSTSTPSGTSNGTPCLGIGSIVEHNSFEGVSVVEEFVRPGTDNGGNREVAVSSERVDKVCGSALVVLKDEEGRKGISEDTALFVGDCGGSSMSNVAFKMAARLLWEVAIDGPYKRSLTLVCKVHSLKVDSALRGRRSAVSD